MDFAIGDKTDHSRLWLGTGKFASSEKMLDAVKASATSMVTVAMKRVNWQQGSEDIVQPLKSQGVHLLPNTAGAREAKEAVLLAQLGRELMNTEWVKLEIHPDQRYLMPDPISTLEAACQLVADGFKVLPYVHADPVLCRQLEDIGCTAVMPLAAPIGSNQGLASETFLQIIIEQASIPVIVDAGLGAPSHAVRAMEMGADAVLVNTAIASAANPVIMASAFKLAVDSGRLAYTSGLGEVSATAQSTSPLNVFLETLA